MLGLKLCLGRIVKCCLAVPKCAASPSISLGCCALVQPTKVPRVTPAFFLFWFNLVPGNVIYMFFSSELACICLRCMAAAAGAAPQLYPRYLVMGLRGVCPQSFCFPMETSLYHHDLCACIFVLTLLLSPHPSLFFS